VLFISNLYFSHKTHRNTFGLDRERRLFFVRTKSTLYDDVQEALMEELDAIYKKFPVPLYVRMQNRRGLHTAMIFGKDRQIKGVSYIAGPPTCILY
jgi:hypothetical protein